MDAGEVMRCQYSLLHIQQQNIIVLIAGEVIMVMSCVLVYFYENNLRKFHISVLSH